MLFAELLNSRPSAPPVAHICLKPSLTKEVCFLVTAVLSPLSSALWEHPDPY